MTNNAPTTVTSRAPLRRRRWVQATGAVLALALVGGAAVGGATLAGSRTTVIRPAANSASATPKAHATPKPTKATAPRVRPRTPTAYAAAPGPDKYAQDILGAGITAPVSWIDKTGQQLAADWRAGYTAAWTDANVLLPAGVWPSHLAPFDQITARHFGVTPPAQGIEPTPAAPAAPAPAPSPSTSAPPVSGDPVAGTGTGPACTTVAGYFPGGLPGHEDERPGDQGFCIPDHLG